MERREIAAQLARPEQRAALGIQVLLEAPEVLAALVPRGQVALLAQQVQPVAPVQLDLLDPMAQLAPQVLAADLPDLPDLLEAPDLMVLLVPPALPDQPVLVGLAFRMVRISWDGVIQTMEQSLLLEAFLLASLKPMGLFQALIHS